MEKRKLRRIPMKLGKADFRRDMSDLGLFPFLVAAALADSGLTVRDLAIGVISGKDVLMSRVLAQAESWFRAVDKVFVYSDSFSSEAKRDIANSAKHTQISFVEIPGMSEHLVGTKWQHPWYSAQPRFLPSLHHLWQSNPTARWFVLADDDTYLFPKNILRRLGKHNSSRPEVLSFFWCSWSGITEFMEPRRDCHPFAQGGPGVIFSRTIMDMVGPHLLDCNEMYNDAEHAASMRIAVCMERLFGYENWTKGAFIKPWRSGLHPGNPESVISDGNTWDAPGSFHQVKPDQMRALKRCHLVEFEDGFVDFSHFAFRTVPVELTRGRMWQMHFGYAIDNFGTHSDRIFAKTDLQTTDNGLTYMQLFDHDVKVVVECRNDHPDSAVDVDWIDRGVNTTIYLRMKCPEKQYYTL